MYMHDITDIIYISLLTNPSLTFKFFTMLWYHYNITIICHSIIIIWEFYFQKFAHTVIPCFMRRIHFIKVEHNTK